MPRKSLEEMFGKGEGKAKPAPLKREKELGYQGKGAKPAPLKEQKELGYQGKGAKPSPLRKPK